MVSLLISHLSLSFTQPTLLVGIVCGLSPPKIVADLSTMDPESSRAFAERISRDVPGCFLLDSPVSGSTLSVQKGLAVFMVGGRDEDFQRIRPILLDLGSRATHLGGNGKGLALKLAINVNLAIQMQGLSEGLVLAEKAGIRTADALDVFLHSAVASPMVLYRGPFIAQLPQPAWFSCEMMQKDVQLALSLSRQVSEEGERNVSKGFWKGEMSVCVGKEELKVEWGNGSFFLISTHTQVNAPLPLTSAVSQSLTCASAIGYGEEDMAALYHVAAQMAGTRPPTHPPTHENAE